MKTLVCFALCCAAAAAADVEKRYWNQNRAVEQAREQKDYRQATALLRTMRADPEFRVVFQLRLNTEYNLACIHALAGHKTEALDAFESAVKLGLNSYDHVRRDSDLDSIRQEPRFKELMTTLSRRARFWEDPAIATPSVEGVEIPEDLRLAGLAKLWAEVKHNFAWFEHVPELNWDAAYVTAIPKARQAKSTEEYYKVLQELAAMLKDAHTNVQPPWSLAQRARFRPPLRTRLLEGKVVVLEGDGVVPGMEVLTVDGVPVREYSERNIAPYVSASTRQGLEQNTYGTRLLAGDKDSSVELTLRDENGVEVKKKLARTRERYEAAGTLLEFRALAGGIGYLALNSFNDAKVVGLFADQFPAIARTGALIIDVRQNGGGNSGNGDRILAYFFDKPVPRQSCRTRLMRSSNRAWGTNQDWSDDTPFSIDPHPNLHYGNPVVVLTSAVSCSATEDFLLVLDNAHRVTIVGEPTCGSTGQPLFVGLPGGGSVRICTRNCRYPDGREFNGVGIQPQIRVSPTVADIRKGRDTVLEAALAYVQKQTK